MCPRGAHISGASSWSRSRLGLCTDTDSLPHGAALLCAVVELKTIQIFQESHETTVQGAQKAATSHSPGHGAARSPGAGQRPWGGTGQSPGCRKHEASTQLGEIHTRCVRLDRSVTRQRLAPSPCEYRSQKGGCCQITWLCLSCSSYETKLEKKIKKWQCWGKESQLFVLPTGLRSLPNAGDHLAFSMTFPVPEERGSCRSPVFTLPSQQVSTSLARRICTLRARL